ncbi:MAG: PD40 domain-containing protein, partial [Chloroflexi bacterium]|nr:PD40 domain-containing protein [Chloroflexota bacterium]
PPTDAPTEPPAPPPTDAPTEPPTEAPAPTEVPSEESAATATPTRTPTATATATQTQVGSVGSSAIQSTATPSSTPTPQKTGNQQQSAAPAPATDDPYVGLGVACNNDLSATFTITNIGGPLMGGSYTVSEPGKPPVTNPLNLDSGESISFNAAGNATVTVTYSTSVLDVVNLQAVGTCLPLPTNTPTLTPTATNTPGPSPTPTHTATITPTKTPKPTKTSTPTNTPGPSPTPTNTKTPKPTNTPSNTPTPTNTKPPTSTPTASLTPTATNPPVDGQLDLKVFCNVDESATFVITNVSGVVSDGNYVLSDPASSGSLDILPGNFVTIDGAGNATMTVTYKTSKLSSVTLSVTGSCLRRPTPTPTQTASPTATPTEFPPALDAQGACAGIGTNTAVFVVSNKGGDMDKPYQYVVKDANGNVVDSGTINLQAGQNTTITVSGNSSSYTLSSPDDAGLTEEVDMTACVTPPPPPANLSVSGACTSNIGEATFVITNNGAAMTAPYPYIITDANGAVAGSGMINLGAQQSVTIKVTGNSTSYTFSTPNDTSLTTVVDMTACVTPPPPPPPANLSISGVCTSNAGVATFVLTNNGADMQVPYPYTITDANGSVVQTGSLTLAAGQSVTLTVAGASSAYTFSTPSDSSLTTTVDMTACVPPPPPPPSLTANGVCTSNNGTAAFNITNNGGDMPVAYIYTISDADGNAIETGTFQLKSGQNIQLTVTGDANEFILTITDANKITVRAAMASCKEPLLSVTPGSGAPEVCIECLVFHTFRDNNLEVYRLDGIEGQPGYKLYNLSKDESVDSRPSRAPNDTWVVFQSERDGNVELYYTDLAGSGEAIRLTNTQSNNTNPMYGPDARTIVFQSDRNGTFDLFTIDQQTGKETQLTSDLADDINAFYSPDIKKLVFQSNRNGNWDLYILDVETGTEFQLTDSTADETFPAWSKNGKQIAFISEDSNGATDLYVIDLDGGNLRRITTDGKTVNAVWSPEGDRIAYQSERNGNLDIYSYDFRNNKEYRVTDYEGKDSGPTWDCGGTNLAFTSLRDGDPNIFQVFWQGGAASNMTIDPATDKWSQWRPSNDVSSVGY